MKMVTEYQISKVITIETSHFLKTIFNRGLEWLSKSISFLFLSSCNFILLTQYEGFD